MIETYSKKSYNSHAILISEAFGMKKYSLLVVCLLMSTLLLSACSTLQSSNTIKYERKLGKYFEQENVGGTIDLSEGPKLRYDTKLGPRDLNFDIKIVNPY